MGFLDQELTALQELFVQRCIDADEAKDFTEIFELLSKREFLEPQAKILAQKITNVSHFDLGCLEILLVATPDLRENLIKNIRNFRYILHFLHKIQPAQSQGLVFEHPTATFSRISSLNEQVVMLNLFNGINITNVARIIEVKEYSVKFEVDVMQILAMKQEGHAFILRNEILSKHLRAEILDFSIAERSVELGNFIRVDTMSASLRAYSRVHPEQFTKVSIHSQSGVIDGNLYDISIGGMAVLSTQDSYISPLERVKAEFEMLGEPCMLELELVERLEYNGAMRYCFRIAQGGVTQKLREYVDRRVVQTLKDLRNQANLYR